MARLSAAKERKAKKTAVKLRAFDLYVTLDAKLKRVHSVTAIAKKLGISVLRVKQWAKEERWAERLEIALDKAKAEAANSVELKSLLTNFLYPAATIPKTAGEPVGKALSKYEKRKVKRIQKTLDGLDDMVFEIRYLNHKYFRALAADGERRKMPKFALKFDGREGMQKAWMDSCKMLFDLFGVSTLRELAVEVAADSIMRDIAQKHIPGAQGSSAVVVNNSMTNVILGEKGHTDVMEIMLGGSAKIDGPKEYFGPKEITHAERDNVESVNTTGLDPEGEE